MVLLQPNNTSRPPPVPDSSERALALEAVQVSVSATRDEATIRGVLPVTEPSNLSRGNEDADVRPVVTIDL